MNKIRLGLMLDSFDVPRWEYEMIKNIVESNHTSIILCVIREGPCDSTRIEVSEAGCVGHASAKQSIFKRIWFYRNQLLLTAYQKWERRKQKPNPDALEMVSIASMLKAVPKFSVKVRQGKYTDTIEASDVDVLAGHGLDVLFRVNGFRIIRGEVLTRGARFGVWSYHHGDNTVKRGAPPGLHEFLEGEEHTGAILQQLTDDLDNGIVLSRIHTSTNLLYSHLNLNHLLWRSSTMLSQALQQLHSDRDSFMARVLNDNKTPAFYDRPMYTWPTDKDFIPRLPAIARRHIRVRINDRFYRDYWNVLYSFGPGLSTSFWRYKEARPPAGVYWADPFVLWHEDAHYLFMEEYHYKTGKGRIVVMVSDGKGAFGPAHVALEEEGHLSYPFVFRDGDRIYMVPETNQQRRVTLYEAIEFPYTWRPVRNLLDGERACDATLFCHEGMWWLFVNFADPEWTSFNEQLYLFYSEDLREGTWKPHPLNPIVSDPTGARCAGKIFRHANKIYRPTQDCAQFYGSGIVMKEILELSKDGYKEREVQRFRPHWNSGYSGMHTLNYDHGLTVIDVMTMSSNQAIGK